MKTDLNELRSTIDEIDDKILHLIANRREAVRRVGSTKKDGDLPVRNEAREIEVLDRLIASGRERGLSSVVVTDAFQAIIRDSIELQKNAVQQANMGDIESGRDILEIAFQGGEAAYSDEAARRFFGGWADEVIFTGMSQFSDVVNAVEEGAVTYGLLPIENTTAGSITEVQDLLLDCRLRVVGETVVQVDHCLIGLEQQPLSELRRVISHPQALAQCSRFLGSLAGCQQEAFADTALAVARVRDDGDPSQAAIASAGAARLYGLQILRTGINNQEKNFTRFLVLSRKPHTIDLKLNGKTALFVGTEDRPGALLDALAVLHRFGINLTKLESRPRPGSPFEYSFYLELEGQIGEPRVDNALDELRTASRFLKLLGSFPAWENKASSPSPKILAGSRLRIPLPLADPARTEKQEEPYELVCLERKPEGSIVRVGNVDFSNHTFTVIAGPCSVESPEQIRRSARIVREYGGKVLRGGCFKPRTSPYSFQGLGYEGVELLAAAGREYGLPTVTEVMAPEDIARVSEMVDAIQIGERNMQNFNLLSEAGRVDIPVILKRGISASVQELLCAAEYILAEGNQRVILCERGIRTFEASTRNTLDLCAVALLKLWTHLPIIVDPSHAAGRRELVTPLAMAAHAIGPAGIMVEIHPRPDEALSDGPQALDEHDFGDLMATLVSR